MTYEVEVLMVPPSFNATRYKHWAAARRAKDALQAQIGWSLMAAGVPRRLGAVSVEARLTFPVRRKRDEGNFRTPVEKATGDALVAGGWLEDDDPEHFRFGSLTVEREVGPAKTVLLISPLSASPERE